MVHRGVTDKWEQESQDTIHGTKWRRNSVLNRDRLHILHILHHLVRTTMRDIIGKGIGDGVVAVAAVEVDIVGITVIIMAITATTTTTTITDTAIWNIRHRATTTITLKDTVIIGEEDVVVVEEVITMMTIIVGISIDAVVRTMIAALVVVTEAVAVRIGMATTAILGIHIAMEHDLFQDQDPMVGILSTVPICGIKQFGAAF